MTEKIDATELVVRMLQMQQDIKQLNNFYREMADAEKNPKDKIELEAGIKGWERHLETIKHILTRVSLE